MCSNATDFSSGLAWGQVTTLTGKMVTGSLLAMIGPTEAFCGALGGMGVLLAGGVVAVARGAQAAALLSFIAYKLMKSTVWTTLALLTKESFGPHLVGRVWPILTTSSRVVSSPANPIMYWISLFRLGIAEQFVFGRCRGQC